MFVYELRSLTESNQKKFEFEKPRKINSRNARFQEVKYDKIYIENNRTIKLSATIVKTIQKMFETEQPNPIKSKYKLID